ncbi:MAG: hypothetical protein HYW89_00270 [Candidatus Sungiibacteriota bacterium]|uniref:Orotate phosphoribosyltransferase n=1 Tax=Candidatus Sungiibacteriota bacterium TaxID=2750080 RepID=A0A7T5US71_9BACT|nr:MAG: hypothetical protein HYW89_00270 [Candidatus Sungbacteria bacterium]
MRYRLEEKCRAAEEYCAHILKQSGAILNTEETGEHYQLFPSGLHTGMYIQLARIFEKGPAREQMAKLLLYKLKQADIDLQEINVLLGPALGAIPLICALQTLAELEHTRAVYVERDRQFVLALSRGFSLNPQERILIVDDMAVSFSTIRETIAAAHRACASQGYEANIIGFAILIDRPLIDREHSELLWPTLKYACGLCIPLEAYNAAPPLLKKQCPYCQRDIKLIQPKI